MIDTFWWPSEKSKMGKDYQVLNFTKEDDKKIKKLVKKVYYYNVDALLIDEEDFHKLESLGYIGTRLGQFKIEHVFSEIYIQSARKWIGRAEDGSLVGHGLSSFPDTLI